MVKLVEVCELLRASSGGKQKYTLREVYINPKHVVSLREDTLFKDKLTEGILPEKLDDRQEFTRVTLDKGHTGMELVVVGMPHVVESKLKEEKTKSVLKG